MRTSTEERLRTCIGCRQRREQHKLFRCVYGATGAMVNRNGSGRGAWVCGAECAQRALREGAFPRAWRIKVEPREIEELICSIAGSAVKQV